MSFITILSSFSYHCCRWTLPHPFCLWCKYSQFYLPTNISVLNTLSYQQAEQVPKMYIPHSLSSTCFIHSLELAPHSHSESGSHQDGPEDHVLQLETSLPDPLRLFSHSRHGGKSQFTLQDQLSVALSILEMKLDQTLTSAILYGRPVRSLYCTKGLQ